MVAVPAPIADAAANPVTALMKEALPGVEKRDTYTDAFVLSYTASVFLVLDELSTTAEWVSFYELWLSGWATWIRATGTETYTFPTTMPSDFPAGWEVTDLTPALRQTTRKRTPRRRAQWHWQRLWAPAARPSLGCKVCSRVERPRCIWRHVCSRVWCICTCVRRVGRVVGQRAHRHQCPHQGSHWCPLVAPPPQPPQPRPPVRRSPSARGSLPYSRAAFSAPRACSACFNVDRIPDTLPDRHAASPTTTPQQPHAARCRSAGRGPSGDRLRPASGSDSVRIRPYASNHAGVCVSLHAR